MDDQNSATLLAPALVLDLEQDILILLGISSYDYSTTNITDTNTVLSKRTDVNACIQSVAAVSGLGVAATTLGIYWKSANRAAAGSIYDQSKYHNCGVVSAVVAHDFKYIYSAHGANCDTTAQQSTIEGALGKAYDMVIHNNPNAIWCLELTHNGSWHGYLLIGPNGHGGWSDNLHCGADNEGYCVSGGSNDVSSR